MEMNFWIWMFLVVFMIHNFEEIFTIEYWYKKIYPRLQERLPNLVRQQLESIKTMTAGQFTMAVFVLFIPVTVLLIISVTTEQYFLFLGVNLFFALNILIHPLQALFLKRYVPGLWTAVFVILPYNLMLFPILERADVWDTRSIVCSILVVLLLLPTVPLGHKVAEYWQRNYT